MTKGFWVLTRYQDVFDVSRDQDRFSSYEAGSIIWDLGEAELERQRSNIMNMRPADHTAMKHVVMPAAFAGGADVEKKSLVILFDKSGVVMKHTMSVSHQQVKRGG